MLVAYNVAGFDDNFEAVKPEEGPRTFLDSVVYAVSQHSMIGDPATIPRTVLGKILTLIHITLAWIYMIMMMVH
jgi:hypothetical protein